MRISIKRGEGFLKRIFCICSAVLLFLSACSPAGVPRGETRTSVHGAADAALPNAYTLAVAPDTNATLQKAAERFCEYANTLSKGSFSFSVRNINDPADALKSSGRVRAALVDGKQAEALHPMFAVLNEPFTYRSYEDFSMKLNSGGLLQKLSGASGVDVFSAYYTGSCFALSQAPVDREYALYLRPEENDAPDGEEFTLTVPETGTAESLALLRIAVTQEPLLAKRTGELIENRAVTEVTAGEFEIFSRSGYTAESGMADETLVLSRTFHTARPTWLMLSAEFYESLSPFGRVALEEAAALLYSDIDKKYLERDDTVLALAVYDGLTVSTAFNGLRTGILTARAEKGGIEAWEKDFREFLNNIV